jgi:hypothetical protein
MLTPEFLFKKFLVCGGVCWFLRPPLSLSRIGFHGRNWVPNSQVIAFVY